MRPIPNNRSIKAQETTGSILNMQVFASSPAFLEFQRLIYSLFGMTLGIMGPDGSHYAGSNEAKANPFCRTVQNCGDGMNRCIECDKEHAKKAAAGLRSLRYKCHAGLTEFLIPVKTGHEVTAVIQCGQVLDQTAAQPEWQAAKTGLSWYKGDMRQLARLFKKTPVLSGDKQKDLIALLELIANNIATIHTQAYLLEQSHQEQIVAKAESYIRANFRDMLTLERIARAAGASRRNLTRLFRLHKATTLLSYLQQLRVDHAKTLLRSSNAKVTEIALASGFGSIQQFNRVFREHTGFTPRNYQSSPAYAS